MKVLERVEKFPGGLVVIPLLITALINTVFPQALAIGGVTTALFRDGTYPILGLLLFFSGCQLRLDRLGTAMKRGGVLVAVKIALAFGTGFLLMNTVGPAGFCGVSTVALVAAISNNNPAVYLALVEKYGDEADVSAFGLLCLISTPVLPLAILGLSGGSFDPMGLVTLLVPFVLGSVLANLDHNIAKFMQPGAGLMLPFIGFCFGASVNLLDAFRSTGGGLLLLVVYTVVTIIPQLAVDTRLLHRPGYAAIASCTIGGTAVVIPTIVAQSMPIHASYADTAVAQLAFAMTFSCLLTPFLTKLWVKHCAKKSVRS